MVLSTALLAALLAGPFSGFDELPHTTVAVPGGALRVAFEPPQSEERARVVLAWTRGSAEALSRYLGKFPVEDVRLLVRTVEGEEIHGTTWAYPRPSTRVVIGSAVPDRSLRSSWVMAHELVHHMVPEMDDRHEWLNEGLATYVEPVARAQASELSVEEVWRWLLTGTPKGQPREGDRGLDHTPTWGRRYWGGALFWLLADVELRRRTGNTRGVQHALSALARQGLNNQHRLSIDAYLERADAATATSVLSELYAVHASRAVTVDLDALFARLGVALVGGKVTFDDRAPDAAIRRAITTATPRPRTPPGTAP